MQLKLYHYWRSSSSWRVRWALALKGIEYSFVAVNLLEAEQKSKEHLQRNPSGFVPALEVVENGNTQFLAESTAIIEWLDENFSEPKLLPGDSFQRAKNRQLVQIINAGTQPLQNLQTQKHLSDDKDVKLQWTRHWIENGLTSYENLVVETAGKFSMGDEVSMADLFLIPQVYNAIRFDVDLKNFPTILKINENALKTEGCQASHPDKFKP